MFRNIKYQLIIIVSAIFINVGKSQVIEDTIMNIKPGMVPDVTITEKPYQSGDLTMTQNQYKMMPASFQDPARILIKYPGFSTPNDGANGIIFRGLAPETARWQLFGADIVNPNHLSNAGTANDLSTESAGGVNALSGSILGYYHFEANPAEVSKNDVLSGISDMKLAPKIKSFIDLNLIGLEAGLNLSSKNENATRFKNIYAAYRYSFVGLLSQLGVNFGNEKIGYQDFTINAEVIRSSTINLNVFGTLGSSSNNFQAVSHIDSISRFKDMQDIFYKSNLAIGGAQFLWYKRGKAFQNTTIFSQRKNERRESTNERFLSTIGQPYAQFHDQIESLISSHSYFSKFTKKDVLKVGLRANGRTNDIITGRVGTPDLILSFYPYIHFSKNVTEKFKYELGSGVLYDSYSEEFTPEPFATMTYGLTKHLAIEASYRHSSQLLLPALPLRQYIDKIPRVKAHNVQLALSYILDDLNINVTGFFHQLRDLSNYVLAGIGNKESHFNIFNGSFLGYDQYLTDPVLSLRDYSRGRVFGASASVDNVFYAKNKHKFSYNVNGSLFNAEYQIPELVEEWFPGKYNYGYTSSVLLSYETNLSGTKKAKVLTLSLANHLRGGQREPVLGSEPNSSTGTIYESNSYFSTSFAPYQRLDFRVVYQPGSGKKYQHRWSIDIQNLLNRQNDGFRYYDRWLKKVILQNQLGLVPVLSYRLEW